MRDDETSRGGLRGSTESVRVMAADAVVVTAQLGTAR